MATTSSIPRPLQSCEHKTNIGCILTALPICCACADKRPMAPAYPVYIDGEGMKTRGKRWARYCWKCRDFYNLSDIASFASEDTATATPSSTDMTSRLNSETLLLPPQMIPNPLRDPGRIYSDLSPSDHPRRSTRQQLNPFGTREDVESEDYQSPVSQMFQRFYDHAQRLNAAVQVAPPPIPAFDTDSLRAAVIELSDEEQDTPRENAIDRQIDRPAPIKPEDLKISIACKICLEQRIDTLIEPCMHLALCRWCSDVWQLNSRHLRAQDPSLRDPWKCPVCRKRIMNIRRVYF